jgi:Fe2+ or Zn2+ uptake regulation protein
MKWTWRLRVTNFLLCGNHPYTATELHRSLNIPDHPVTLATLSGVLKKMYDNGELYRVDDWGPRGGYGYQVNHA